MTEQFRPHPIYYLLIGVMMILACLLAWGMSNGITLGEVLFFGITMVAVSYFLFSVMTSLTVTDTAISVRHPLKLLNTPSWPQTHGTQAGEKIVFRQLISVERTGRILPALTLLYHPMQANQLIDTDRIIHITLPMVTNQDALHARLEAAIPA